MTYYYRGPLNGMHYVKKIPFYTALRCRFYAQRCVAERYVALQYVALRCVTLRYVTLLEIRLNEM